MADLADVVELNPVEAVDADHEWEVAALEEIERAEAVVQPAGVGQHDRADRADGQLVPHEPEPVLARRAEQIQDQVRVDRDPAEVQRHGRGGLLLDPRQIVNTGAGLGDDLLGAQWRDLADRADHRRLSDPETTGDQYFYRGGFDGVPGRLRDCGYH